MEKIILIFLAGIVLCSACNITNKTDDSLDNDNKSVNENTSNQNADIDKSVHLVPSAILYRLL